MSQSIEIRPGVGMLALLSSMNYKPWYALGEFVDNSISSFLRDRKALAALGQTAVTVTITFDRGAGVIELVDDAGGIAEADVARAFRAAEPPPDRSGLAQFGIGMKSAACWFANTFEVASVALGDAIERSVAFDVRRIVEDQIETLSVEANASVRAHGTSVKLRDLHRPIPTGKTLGKINSYLASIYRDFLRDGLLILEVAGKRVLYEEPAFLSSPRWDAPEGEPQKWRKEIAIELPSGRIATGWAGLRAKGSTAEAGLALLYRRKVVVGAGSAAGQADDLFRPNEIFGSPNSYVSQRLVGELDVSDFQVAHSKDAIIWDRDYDDLLLALRRELDAESLPLLKMAQRYRVLEKGVEVNRRLEQAVDSTVSAASLPVPKPPASVSAEAAIGSPPSELEARTFTVAIEDFETEVTFSVCIGEGRTWLRVLDGDRTAVIEVDRAHKFMQSFAHLPNQDIEPILRLAATLGLAEIRSRRAGNLNASAVRSQVNELLNGPLSDTPLTDPFGPNE